MSEVNLTTEQQLLVETRLNNEQKSTAVAYLLAFFLGYFGTHNFYAGRYKLACFELGAFLFTTITSFGSGKNLSGHWICIFAFFVFWVYCRRDLQIQPFSQKGG